jgi:acetyl-CoA carboxylase biotin carboxyl carrier protein
MVGIVHLAPSPGAAPFVQPGEVVDVHTVVCIIEAMRVMCELRAETSGTITKVLACDGESIAYGQPLFEIR